MKKNNNNDIILVLLLRKKKMRSLCSNWQINYCIESINTTLYMRIAGSLQRMAFTKQLLSEIKIKEEPERILNEYCVVALN